MEVAGAGLGVTGWLEDPEVPESGLLCDEVEEVEAD